MQPPNDAPVQQAERKPVSIEQIQSALQKIGTQGSVIHYNNLSEAQNIDDVFQRWGPNVIILLNIEKPHAPPVGHFIALLQYPEYVEHFDSYGIGIDKELSITHERPYLKRLLEPIIVKVKMGTSRLQRMRNDTNTCGRWTFCRVQHRAKNYEQFVRFIKAQGPDPDKTVTLMTQGLF